MHRLFPALVAGATLLVSAAGCSAQVSRPAAAEAASGADAAFGARVRAYLLAHP